MGIYPKAWSRLGSKGSVEDQREPLVTDQVEFDTYAAAGPLWVADPQVRTGVDDRDSTTHYRKRRVIGGDAPRRTSRPGDVVTVQQ